MKELKEIIEKSNNIVFFGGAGVSTEIVQKSVLLKGGESLGK